jgi:hypothetical protein
VEGRPPEDTKEQVTARIRSKKINDADMKSDDADNSWSRSWPISKEDKT